MQKFIFIPWWLCIDGSSTLIFVTLEGTAYHGIWDLALTGIVPTMHVAAPRDGARLKELLREAVSINDAPSMVRFPKGAVQEDIPAFERRDGIDVLYRGESADVLMISVGAMAAIAVEAASSAYREGVGVVGRLKR